MWVRAYHCPQSVWVGTGGCEVITVAVLEVVVVGEVVVRFNVVV